MQEKVNKLKPIYFLFTFKFECLGLYQGIW